MFLKTGDIVEQTDTRNVKERDDACVEKQGNGKLAEG